MISVPTGLLAGARRAVLALVALGALAQWAFAALDADLHPLEASSPLAGRLGAIGMVLAGPGEHVLAMGTGFLVTPCHVLTAAHVLARSGFAVVPGLPVRFLPSSGERAFALGSRQVFGRVAASGAGFRSDGAHATSNPASVASDWALIELETPQTDVEPFKLLYPGAGLEPGTPISTLGYATSASMTYLYVHENCRRRPDMHGGRFAAQMLLADCAVRPGMSGGPLLVEGGARTLIAAGIVVERLQLADRVFAVAVPVSAFASEIAPLLRRSERCAAGAPFAVPQPARQDAPPPEHPPAR